MIPCVNVIGVKTDCDSPITCRLTWSAHANTPWPRKSHVAHFSFWSRFKPLHNSCGAKCLSNAQNTQSNLWRMKGKQEKTLSFLLWKAVRLCLIKTVIAAATGLFISYWSVLAFFFFLLPPEKKCRVYLTVPGVWICFLRFCSIVWVKVRSLLHV